MNKISKKIVALATMAAFVLTLVPAAAFAATDETQDPAYAEASEYTLMVNGQKADEVEINPGDSVTTQIIVKDANNKTTDKPLDVKLWAVDDKGNISKTVTFTPVASTGAPELKESGVVDNVWYGDVNNGDQYTVKFTLPGKYTLYAKSGDLSATVGLDDLTALNAGDVVNVKTPAVTADSLAFWAADGSQLTTVGDNDNVVKLDFTQGTQIGNFSINGVDTYTLNGFAYQEDGSRATNTVLNLSASRGNDIINLVKDTVTTDDNGAFSIQFKMSKAENANIYVKGDNVNYTIRVIAEDNTPFTIETVEDGGYVLAGDSDWWYTGAEYFSDAVQFELKTKDGDVLNDANALTGEPAAYAGNDNPAAGPYHVDYFDVTVPADSDMTVEDLVLAYDDGVYTLKYVGNDRQHDLVPGKYTVEVALLSNDSATATFTVADFGSIEDVDITMTAVNNYGSDDNEYRITDEVTLGQKVIARAWYVDANGIRVPAQDAQFGIDGKAVYQSSIKPVKGEKAAGEFTTLNNEPANESLLGSQIVVSLFDDQAKQLAQKTLTVVDAYNTYSLAFDPTQGPANEENKVTVSVVDDNDNVAKVTGDIAYYIADQSNEEANIDIATVSEVKNGKGTIQIYSDKETTVDIVVAVKSDTGAIYPATLEYTVGAEDINAENTVVMTIGSTDYVVNNDIVKGDAAPYVDEAWRTMVPFRVLGETFGATVDWDQDSQSVIYTYGDTELVMTIGEDTYTINGEEFDMDTAPVLSGDRTYVPVRFVGEALGYTVTALYDGETGLTASVVFQK